MICCEFERKEFDIVLDGRKICTMTGEELSDGACYCRGAASRLLHEDNLRELFALIRIEKAISEWNDLEYGKYTEWYTQDLKRIGMMYTTCDGDLDGEEHDLQWMLNIDSDRPMLTLYIDDIEIKNDEDYAFRIAFDNRESLASQIWMYCDFDFLYGRAVSVFRDLEQAGVIVSRA